MDTLTAESVMTLKVSELKAQLTSRGLQANGIKSALQKRLVEALQATEEAAAMETEAAPQEEDKIDEGTRYSGEVVFFRARSGYGTICPDGKDAANKNDHVFVHWKQIQSSDPWPSLKKGQKVEYYLGEKANPRKANQKIFAAKVTLEGGQAVTNADERVYPDRSQRFVGVVEQFFFKKGYGFIKPKESFNFDETDFHADKRGTIYFGKEDLKVAYDDRGPSIKRGAECEFVLFKQEKDGKAKYGAAEITKPGGAALDDDDALPKLTLEERKAHAKKKKAAAKKAAKKRKAKEMSQMFKPLSKKMMKQFKKQQQSMMGGMMMNPMMMGGMGGMMNPMMMMGQAQPQMVTLNGQTFMMIPNAQAGGKKKKRRKNKKKKAANAN